MRAGWRRFGENRAEATAAPSDKAVAPAPAAPPWLLGVVIIASTAALLGTSGDGSNPSSSDTSSEDPANFATYEFARSDIEGGSVDLTLAAPAATFYVTLTATDLGPNGAMSSNAALAHVHGTVTTSGLIVGAATPHVSVVTLSPDDPSVGQTIDATGNITFSQSLPFGGNCAAPKEGDCKSHIVLELRRSDDGAADGKVSVHWTFDVESSGQVPAAMSSTVAPRDPPWTVEVTPP